MDDKKHFSISQAADMVGMTAETLRHYDRIGLVRPHEKDECTGYRYYSEQELVRLGTIQALRLMDLPLKEIKQVLEYDDLEKVVDFFKQTEQTANEKLKTLRQAKAKIERARRDYEKKLELGPQVGGLFIRRLPMRMLLLSDTLCHPTLDNLWQYLAPFYEQVGEAHRADYVFDDLAGVYTDEGKSRLFAVCLRYPSASGLTVLPEGPYLCANCSEAERESTLARLREAAREQSGASPPFSLQLVIVSGILQWTYQLQVPLLQKEDSP